jgi:hypothetical protein
VRTFRKTKACQIVNSTILEISAVMKLTFLSKTIRTLGLTAVLSVIVSSGIQQTVQAQTQAETPAQMESIDDAERQARFCAGDYSVVPDRYRTKDGSYMAFELTGIEFSSEQEAAYYQFVAELNRKSDELLPRIRTVENGGFSLRSLDTISDELTRQMDIAQANLSADSTLSTQQKIALLNEQFGQYGIIFEKDVVFAFTLEQELEVEQADRDFQAQIQSILTPEQQQVYLENVDIKRLFASCYE